MILEWKIWIALNVRTHPTCRVCWDRTWREYRRVQPLLVAFRPLALQNGLANAPAGSCRTKRRGNAFQRIEQMTACQTKNSLDVPWWARCFIGKYTMSLLSVSSGVETSTKKLVCFLAALSNACLSPRRPTRGLETSSLHKTCLSFKQHGTLSQKTYASARSTKSIMSSLTRSPL